jgi:hypothetical protein
VLPWWSAPCPRVLAWWSAPWPAPLLVGALPGQVAWLLAGDLANSRSSFDCNVGWGREVRGRQSWESVIFSIYKRGLSRDCKSYIIGSILNVDFGSVDGKDLTVSLFLY